MPNIKSAKKRVKVIAVKSAQNQASRSALRTQIKKANIAIETGAADKGLLPKNTAARRKSALARKANA